MIGRLLTFESRRFSRNLVVLIVLSLQFLSFALGLGLMLRNYLEAQSAQIKNLSFSDDVLTPLYGLLAALMVVAAPLMTMPVYAAARSLHVLDLQQQTTARWQLVCSRWLTVLLWQGLFWLLSLLSLLAFTTANAIDVGQFVTTATGLLLLMSAVLAVNLAISARSANPAIAVVIGYAAIALMCAPDLLPARLGLFGLFLHFRDGIIDLHSVALLLAMSAGGLLTTYYFLWPQHFRRIKWAVLLLLAVLLATIFLPTRSYELTRARNAVPIALSDWLSAQTEPMQVTLVANNTERRAAYLLQLQALQRWQPQLQMAAISNAQLSGSLREQLPDSDGVLLNVKGRQDWINLPDENLLPGLIIRLQHLVQLADAWLVFLEGHGERRLFGTETRDLSQLSGQLQALGYTLAPLQFAASPVIPGNTRVLVLAHVQSELLPSEMEEVSRYVEAGGNLLWLRDPDDAALPELEKLLGVRRIPGTVFDLAGVRRGTPHPAIVVVDHFPAHIATQHIHTLIALPWAAPLQVGHSAFHATEILRSGDESVLVSDPETVSVPPELPRQTYTLGLALDRKLNNIDQRIAVIGDSNFASDTAIKNYGNAPLALQLLRWLAFADQAPALPEMMAPDAVFLPSPALSFLLRYGLPLLLPMVLLGALAISVWRWRKN